MTTFPAAREDRLRQDYLALKARVAILEQQLAQGAGAFAAYPSTSTSHPANPKTGAQIIETDTGLSATWNGTMWVYGGAVLLDRKVLTASQASMTVNVPAGIAFTHLQAIYTARQDTASGGAWGFFQLNGDNAAHYTWETLSGNASTAAAATPTTPPVGGIRYGVIPCAGDTASYFGTGTIWIGNASSTSIFKTAVSTFQGPLSPTSVYTGTAGGLWTSTAAITSLTIFPFSGNLVAGSSVTLIGYP